MSSSEKQLPGLNALRFFAAFAVVIHHIEQIKMVFGFPNAWGNVFVSRAGDKGVTFFFALSGFLITYLLLLELRQNNRIDFKNFYMRRVLRIWPLYYMLTFLGFFVLPHIHYMDVPGAAELVSIDFYAKLGWFIFLSAQVATTFYPGVPTFAGVMWSVGAEEHFYLVWPVLLSFFRRHVLTLLATLTAGLILARIGLAHLPPLLGPEMGPASVPYIQRTLEYMKSFRIECMAIGGVGAWLYVTESPILKFLFLREVQAISAFLFSWAFYASLTSYPLLMHGYAYPWIGEPFFALFATWIILNVGCNPNSFLKIKSRTLDFLGQISYGLYSYNWITITFVVTTVKRWGGIQDSMDRELFIYGTSTLLTVAAATLSYLKFEKRFLRIKDRYSARSSAPSERAA